MSLSFLAALFLGATVRLGRPPVGWRWVCATGLVWAVGSCGIAGQGVSSLEAPSPAIAASGPVGSLESTSDAAEDSSESTTSLVHWLRLDGAIHAVSAQRLDAALAQAAVADADLFVIQLDTPGGSLPATRAMVRSLLAAETPSVVWVGPAGAQAASAGFFLLLAADVAAMAPESNTGAAHPVAGDGSDIDGELGTKIEEDTRAWVRSLADRKGRDLALAEAAVVDSRAFTAGEAVDAGLADVLARDRSELFAALEARGRDARPILLVDATQVRVIEHQPTSLHRLLSVIAHPQIAGLLLALGLLGLYVEVSNPGLVIPGTAGALAVVLGLFALSVLPIDTAGLVLLGLALVLFVAETQVPTFGALTVGGTIALLLGLSMVFEEVDPALAPSPWFLGGLGILIAAFVGASSWQTVQARRRRPVSGRDGMLGATGRVTVALRRSPEGADIDPDAPYAGRAAIHGESWRVRSREALPQGGTLRVLAIDGLCLVVEGVAADATAMADTATADTATADTGMADTATSQSMARPTETDLTEP